jgi:methionyl-tRNA formyltransferase
VAAGHEVALVLTQPDRPAGRGMRAAPSPVKRFATANRIDVFQPESFKAVQDLERVRSVKPDALVVAAYGLILPQPLLEAGPLGALNIHASLLPRWRGAAPIQRALLAGDLETGISIMQMDAGLDTGPVLQQRAITIAADDDAGSLHHRLAELGAEMIVDTLARIESGTARAVPQPQAGVTYARKIEKQDTLLDWSRPATELERAVRAFRPAPGASTTLEGEPIKIWRARVAGDRLPPGVPTSDLVVGCGEGALAVEELQRAGGKRLSAADFLRGRPLARDARFR